MPTKKVTGWRWKNARVQVYLRVNKALYTTTLPADSSDDDVLRWQSDTRDRYRLVNAPAQVDSFAADVAAYLARVQSMPTIDQRGAHLELWLQMLGRDRSRHSIKTADVDVVLHEWLQTLEPGTVRKRRTALQSFFAKMDGESQTARRNPVKTAYMPQEPKPAARALDYPDIERALAAMPLMRDTQKHLPPRVNLSRVRARVMAFTGLPPGIIGKVKKHDLNLTAGTVRVAGRTKGGGVEARVLPLTAEGVEAFTAFHQANAYGSFAIESVNRAWKRGCKRAGLDPTQIRLYDLRHSFLTQLYRVTRDLATVARLGLHAEGSPITAIYARAANEDVDRNAVAAFSASMMRGPAPQATRTGRKVPNKVARRRKSNPVTTLVAAS